jgi:hypothetical protein
MMAAVLVFTGLVLAAIVFAVTLVGLLLSLAVRVLLFPLFLLKWLAMALVGIVVIPVVAVVGIVLTVVFSALAFVFGAVLSIPFLPLLAVAVIVWALLRSDRRPAAA